ncbi:acyltransferase family protein [Acinetobacter pittii]|uniref:acyltransferase family protein n=1 Tax=Acinetobacter pittii TaxID=48296 RepID=UPI003AA8305E
MRLALLDYGRFFAAFSVVFFHYFYNGISNGKVTSIDHTLFAGITSYGHFGVQFFFIISGYVIFYSLKHKGATSFLKSRLKRLYPTYWFAVLFTSCFALLWGSGTDMSVNTLQIFVNFTMLQQFLGVNNVDGVYWTLFYEIIFYGIVFLILLFLDFKKLIAFLVIWPFLIIFFNILGNDLIIFNMYFLYFVIGAMFAILKNGVMSKYFAFLILVIAVLAGYYQMYNAGVDKNNNIVIVTLIYLTMLGFFWILNIDKWRNISLPYSKDLGGMTYPIYLIHAHFGYMFLNKFATNTNYYYVYAVLLLIIIVLSWTIWNLIEIKQSDFWYKFFTKVVKPIEKIENKF